MYNLYNPQLSIDRINSQIAELEKLKSQIPLQSHNTPSINQTFQLASNSVDVMRYADSIDDVNKQLIISDTPFFSKDMSILWVKNIKGDVKTYELNEIVHKDEKDLKIDYLMAQIEELKKGIANNERTTDINGSITDTIEVEESTSIPTISKSNKKSK